MLVCQRAWSERALSLRPFNGSCRPFQWYRAGSRVIHASSSFMFGRYHQVLVGVCRVLLAPSYVKIVPVCLTGQTEKGKQPLSDQSALSGKHEIPGMYFTEFLCA